MFAFTCAPGCATTTSERGPAPPGAHQPVMGDDGMFEDCDILFEGCCYRSRRDACSAAGCPDRCTILRTSPGKVSCDAAPER
ncbi:MAG: hypothetical protein CVU56_22530 [Deltaproteobacteria bacterium HGW-Deltaproteobacteria-14]|nr:MAG: hypothetical protein CVU56_22530 [Deltaproteobacteria bacterium HGW-Deltaproteobacteria-14]